MMILGALIILMVASTLTMLFFVIDMLKHGKPYNLGDVVKVFFVSGFFYALAIVVAFFLAIAFNSALDFSIYA